MRFVFITGRVAITVRHWVEERPRDGSTESGSRVEVRRYDEERPEPYNAAPPARLGDPIWRADLFTHDQGAPGNWDRAHQHRRWTENVPGPRDWDPQMTADPIAYTLARLRDLPGLLEESGASELASTVDRAELDLIVPSVARAIEATLKPAGQAAVRK